MDPGINLSQQIFPALYKSELQGRDVTFQFFFENEAVSSGKNLRKQVLSFLPLKLSSHVFYFGYIVKVYENKSGKMYPDMQWEPKEAFKALAEYYKGE